MCKIAYIINDFNINIGISTLMCTVVGVSTICNITYCNRGAVNGVNMPPKIPFTP